MYFDLRQNLCGELRQGRATLNLSARSGEFEGLFMSLPLTRHPFIYREMEENSHSHSRCEPKISMDKIHFSSAAMKRSASHTLILPIVEMYIMMTCAALVWSTQLSGPTSRFQKGGGVAPLGIPLRVDRSCPAKIIHEPNDNDFVTRDMHILGKLFCFASQIWQRSKNAPNISISTKFDFRFQPLEELSSPCSPRTHRPFTLSLIIEYQTNNEEANHFSVLRVDCGCLHSLECEDDLEGRERIAGFPFSLIPKIVFTFWFLLSNVLPLVRLTGQQSSRPFIPSSSFGRNGSRIDGTWRWRRFCCWERFFY